MENTVKERIMIFLAFKEMKPATFERLCGLSNGTLKQMKNEPRLSNIEKILETFPELNREWLITGQGEMLVPSQSTGNITSNDSTVAANIGGDNQQNSGLVIEVLARQLGEKDRQIQEQQRLTAKSQEQIDRLLGIIEKMS